MVSSFNVSHGAPIGRTERCFRTEWPPSHVNIALERHFLINPWVSSRDCRIPAITALTRARGADSRIRGARGRLSRLAGKGSITQWQIEYCRSHGAAWSRRGREGWGGGWGALRGRRG